MVIHNTSIEKGTTTQSSDISQPQKRKLQPQNKSDQAPNIINNNHSSKSLVVPRPDTIIPNQKMEVDTCYESRLVDGNSCAMMQRLGTAGGMTHPANGRRRKQRSQRQGRPCAMNNVNNFEQATEFLHHFHAITSRSLDVIHETIDMDDADESDTAMMDRVVQSPSNGLSAMRRTKTCSCLLEAQTSATIGTHHGWFLQDSHDDDEWGFYSEDFDPSWSTSTRTVNQGITPLRH